MKDTEALEVCPNCGRHALRGVKKREVIQGVIPSLMGILNPINIIGNFLKMTKADIIDPLRDDVVLNLGSLKCNYCGHYFVICGNCATQNGIISLVSFGPTMGFIGDTSKCSKCGKKVSTNRGQLVDK